MNLMGIAGLVIAYVVGSFPSAYLAGRMLKRIDLRKVGSGNLGTTNVYRELGLVPALIVLACDSAKGALPTALLPGLLGLGIASQSAAEWWAIGLGAAAIAGHAKPIFLLWRGGGKGVATAAGAFLVLTPIPALAAIVTFVVVIVGTRYASLASLVAAYALPAIQWAEARVSPAFYASVGIAVFVTWSHRSNIGRLRAGTEPRIGRPAGGAV